MGYKGNAEYLTVETKRFTYAYRIDGADYNGVALYTESRDMNEGTSISVIYNPENYMQSRINSEVPWYFVMMWIVFSALFYFSGLWWLKYQRNIE